MNRHPNSISYDDVKIKIAMQRLSQEKISFYLATVANITCFLIALGGCGLMISGKVPQGVVTSAMGLVSSAEFSKMAKDSSDRLEKILPELDD